jgi:hypothetical protein
VCLLTLPLCPTHPQKEQSPGSAFVCIRALPDGATFRGMQRLFSMFPRGGPGIGLLLLRLSVAAANLHAYSSLESRVVWALPALTLLCALLCVGALTPLAAVAAAGLQFAEAGNVAMTGAGIGSAILDALALAVLGPGAYSLDALRFGRRVIVLPRQRDRDPD